MDDKLETILRSIVATTYKEAEEVLAYYDGPQLVTVRTPEGQAYIAVHVDETPTSNIWLHAMVDDASLVSITSGKEGFREVYSSGKYRVFSVEYLYYENEDEDETIAKEVIPTEIKEAWLPGRNTFL